MCAHRGKPVLESPSRGGCRSRSRRTVRRAQQEQAGQLCAGRTCAQRRGSRGGHHAGRGRRRGRRRGTAGHTRGGARRRPAQQPRGRVVVRQVVVVRRQRRHVRVRRPRGGEHFEQLGRVQRGTPPLVQGERDRGARVFLELPAALERMQRRVAAGDAGRGHLRGGGRRRRSGAGGRRRRGPAVRRGSRGRGQRAGLQRCARRRGGPAAPLSPRLLPPAGRQRSVLLATGGHRLTRRRPGGPYRSPARRAPPRATLLEQRRRTRADQPRVPGWDAVPKMPKGEVLFLSSRPSFSTPLSYAGESTAAEGRIVSVKSI